MSYKSDTPTSVLSALIDEINTLSKGVEPSLTSHRVVREFEIVAADQDSAEMTMEYILAALVTAYNTITEEYKASLEQTSAKQDMINAIENSASEPADSQSDQIAGFGMGLFGARRAPGNSKPN